MPEFIEIDGGWPEVPEPEGGWQKSCVIADHEWELEIEEGAVILHAINPCSAEQIEAMGPDGWPVCRDRYWEREDIVMYKRVPVKVRHVDDSIPSTPNGPAEYGFYLELEL